jgi:queuine tRNA-ribosyltransferase
MTHPGALRKLQLPHGELSLPVFLPDATRAVVKSVDSADLEAVGAQGVVMSVFHLMQHPGSTTIKALGGLHKMSGWQKPIITDSGGFQAYSMIRQNAKFGSLTDKGIVFRPDGKNKILLTPEKSVQLQLSYGADVVICLDDCTHPEDTEDNQRESVRRTLAWAKRCRAEFDLQLAHRSPLTLPRPLLFAVIQGGGSRELRKQNAEALLEIGFDGFGYGGWPLNSEGELLEDIVRYTRELVPHHFPMHALGIGHPDSIIKCTKMGYDIFDCALPTRDARRGRLMAHHSVSDHPSTSLHPDRSAASGAKSNDEYNSNDNGWSYVYIDDDKYVKSDKPISADCDCPTCKRYSRGYLHHLYQIKDTAFLRLATIHNLRFMTKLIEKVGERR